MYFDRPARPAVLDGWKALGRSWHKKYAAGKAAGHAPDFRWPVRNRVAINQAVLAALKGGNGLGRCHFCDGFPLGETSKETIEHFRSKTAHPRLAFFWPNLFLACDACQGVKGDQEDRRLLKPDDRRYSFERFFIVNFEKGELEPNPMASEGDQDRARVTIKLYGLNTPARCFARKRELSKSAEQDWQSGPYRYLWL